MLLKNNRKNLKTINQEKMKFKIGISTRWENVQKGLETGLMI
jgi:hypothetical protein